MTNTISKSADFLVKAIIIFITLVSIIQFAAIYNSLIFTILGLLMLIALITKGVVDMISSRQ